MVWNMARLETNHIESITRLSSGFMSTKLLKKETQIYSTDFDINTGKTLNGKSVYRKVYINAPYDSSNVLIEHVYNLTVKEIVSVQFILKVDNRRVSVPTDLLTCWIDTATAGKIKICSRRSDKSNYAGWNLIAIIEYTKE